MAGRKQNKHKLNIHFGSLQTAKGKQDPIVEMFKIDHLNLTNNH